MEWIGTGVTFSLSKGGEYTEVEFVRTLPERRVLATGDSYPATMALIVLE